MNSLIKKLLHGSLLIFLALTFTQCSEEDPNLTESFFKIYDDSNADLSYNPIDIVETIDGFIILTGTELTNTDFMGVQLMKLDDEGNFIDDMDLDDYVIPVGEIYMIDSISYFFAMNPTTLQAVLLGVNPQLEVTVETAVGGLNYPLASSLTASNELLLLSYDPLNLTTEISRVGLDGSFLGGNSYSIGPGSDVEQNIINHYLQINDQPLPFFCGEISTGSYYFNGFYNYSFSLVFSDFSDNPLGVVQGQSVNAGIRAAMSLTGGNFAVAGYQFDENFQLSSTSLSTTGITSSVDLYPGNMAEVKPYTPTKIIRYSSESQDYTVFASESKGGQILLYFYNATSGEVAGVTQIGFLNPFTLSSIKATAENSITVVGTTFVAGRFERVTVTKLSKSEINSFLK